MNSCLPDELGQVATLAAAHHGAQRVRREISARQPQGVLVDCARPCAVAGCHQLLQGLGILRPENVTVMSESLSRGGGLTHSNRAGLETGPGLIRVKKCHFLILSDTRNYVKYSKASRDNFRKLYLHWDINSLGNNIICQLFIYLGIT